MEEYREAAKIISGKIKKGAMGLRLYEDYYQMMQGMINEGETGEGVEGLKWLSERISAMVPTLLRDDLGLSKELVNLHKRALRAAAPYDFDSYLLYVEWNRAPERKFYPPRRKVLKVVVDDLQDLADGKLDFLSVSLPPRVGKLLSDDTPVMTADGWKNHGDLKVGDYVVGQDGEYKMVEYVFPKGEANYEVAFTNGEKIKCHGNHEWYVYDRHVGEYRIMTTNEIIESGIWNIFLEYRPTHVRPFSHKVRIEDRRCSVGIRSIVPIDPVQGNCIQVEGGIYRVGKSMLPTHNSTLCIFFMTWIMGKYPNEASVMSGHSDKLTDGFYRELLSIITDNNEYLWNEVFPGIKIADNSAKNETIDLDRRKRFPTITCRSISGTLTGAVEVGSNGILYVDDIIEDLEESLNPLRLQAKYDAYLNQLKDRKKMGAKELMVGTRWNVADVQGRIEEQYAGNPRYRFRVIPAVDEEGHSNFIYGFNLGFDDKYYEDMKESIDDATWNAKYLGRPYVRDGLLFPEEELQTYNGVLPDGDALKFAVCDVAWGGGDSLAMAFVYVYGDSVYIHDVIFNRGDKTATYPVVIGRIAQHMPNKVRFESNNGGTAYRDHVDDELKKQGIHINLFCKPAPNNQSKLGRIIQFAPDIKRFYFLDERHRSREYKAFMREVTTFVQTGRNPHDDACDCLSMVADELYHNSVASVQVIKRIF